MPREESNSLKTIEDNGADDAINATIDGMTQSYIAYINALRERRGLGNRRVTSKLRDDIRHDVEARLASVD